MNTTLHCKECDGEITEGYIRFMLKTCPLCNTSHKILLYYCEKCKTGVEYEVKPVSCPSGDNDG